MCNQLNFHNEIEDLFSDENTYIFDCKLSDFISKTIIPHKDQLPILYRYSPADYYNIRSLETGKMYLSEIGKMNDIFEGITDEIDDKTLSEIEKLYDLAYIKSFSEKYDNLIMWSNYADNFSGMCVAYDVKKLQDNILYHLFPVRYSNNRNTKSNLISSFRELEEMKHAKKESNDYSFDFLKDVMGLFLTKSVDWKYEEEWRLIVSYLQMNADYDEVKTEGDFESEKELYKLDSKNIEFNCAVKIYLGPKMESVKKIHLKEIGEKLSIDVIELQLSNKEYKLIPNDKEE